MFKVKNIKKVKKINDMLIKEKKHNNKMLRTQLEAVKENTHNLMVENFENPKVYKQLSNAFSIISLPITLSPPKPQ